MSEIDTSMVKDEIERIRELTRALSEQKEYALKLHRDIASLRAKLDQLNDCYQSLVDALAASR